MKEMFSRFDLFYAKLTFRLYRLQVRLDNYRKNHSLKLTILVLLLMIFLSVLSISPLQHLLGTYFRSSENVTALKSLLSSTGSALIGATAIAFSLVVFAMQINIERMPHGLFRKLSSDRRLLGSFLSSFLMAIIAAATSLIPNGKWAIQAIIVTCWCIVIILMLFLYAYRRALQLINPIMQLTIMSSSVRQEMHKWNNFAEKAVIILNKMDGSSEINNEMEEHFNPAKYSFFTNNAEWSNSSFQAINYAISYAKKFAEQGDYEVTECSFKSIILINATYCAVKNGTFIGSNVFIDVPGTTDSFINTSLELLRQSMQTSLSKGDEKLAESTLRCISSLHSVYLCIDYSGRDRTKHHALLAASYMGSAVESVIPHKMPDLMMEGIRLMGKAATLSLEHTAPTDIVGLAGKITSLSTVGLASENNQPVTLIAFEQLADITYQLIVKGKQDIRYTVNQLRSNVTIAAKIFLETPDTQFNSRHCSTMGAYFSSTKHSSLRSRLMSLVNLLLETPGDNVRAHELIRNIEVWADQIYVQQKELLLLAVKKRSFFTFDIIHWTVGVTELLNVLSNAPACTDYLEEKLRRHAVWLISIITWLPDDNESIIFLENFSLTESIFEAGISGLERGCTDYYMNCIKLLLDWGLKGGKYDNGREILETAVKGLVVLVTREGAPSSASELKKQFQEKLANNQVLCNELRNKAAARLVKYIEELQRHTIFHSSIDQFIMESDQDEVINLIYEIAESLSPEIKNTAPVYNKLL